MSPARIPARGYGAGAQCPLSTAERGAIDIQLPGSIVSVLVALIALAAVSRRNARDDLYARRWSMTFKRFKDRVGDSK